MKNKIISQILSLTGAIIILAGVAGCKDMFIDPTKDKTTGETVTLLLIDRNFIKTKFYVQLVDNITGEEITSEPVTVYFIGADSANMVTFGGEKKAVYTTSSAFLEVGYDPAIPVNNENPIQFTLFAMSEHYTSVARYYTYTTEGVKNIVVKLYRQGSVGPLLKTIRPQPFTVKFNNALWSTGLVKEFDGGGTGPLGNGYYYHLGYKSYEGGRVTCSDLTDPVLYSEYGVYYYWKEGPLLRYHFPPDPPRRDVVVPAGADLISAVKKTGLNLCTSNLKIRVNGPAGGSGSFNYRIDFSDGSSQEGRITCSKFPSDNVIEQIYFPTADESVTVNLYSDAQYYISEAVQFNSPCGETAEFNADPKSNLKTYKFITRYTCPGSATAFALSIRGQFMRSGSLNSWTDFAFVGGTCELHLEEAENYEFRINVDGDYYSFTLPTDPEKIKGVIEANKGDNYTIKTLTVTPTASLVTVKADVQFSTGICDYLKK